MTEDPVLHSTREILEATIEALESLGFTPIQVAGLLEAAASGIRRGEFTAETGAIPIEMGEVFRTAKQKPENADE